MPDVERKINILLVDDSPEIPQLIADILREKAECTIVGTPEDALKKMEEVVFDATLTDMQLGKGILPLEVIHKAKDTMLVEAYSADLTEEETARQAGVDNFWQLPFDTIESIEQLPKRVMIYQRNKKEQV